MSQPPNEPQLSEEQIRQIEAEMERITVDDVLLQTLVTLLNLAARKGGLATPPGTPSPPAPKPDLEQMRPAIDGARAILQTLVTLLNLAARKAGLASPPGEGPPPDLEQMRQAIDGARAILPLVEQRHADQLGPVRDTLSQLQMAYSQLRAQGGGGEPPEEGGGEGGGEPPKDPEKPEGPGPAQSSGRLWIPGQ